MSLFAICLCGAGAVLSVVARFSGLVAVVSLVALAILAGTLLHLVGLAPPASAPWAIVVAVIALQVGYGLGVIVRARLRGFREGRRARPGADAAAPRRDGRARADS